MTDETDTVKAYRKAADKAAVLGTDSAEFNAINSPLTEAEPESINEFFNRIDKKLTQNIPREITDSEIDDVVDWLLTRRKIFNEEQQAGIKAGPKGTGSRGGKKASAPKTVKEALNIVL